MKREERGARSIEHTTWPTDRIRVRLPPTRRARRKPPTRRRRPRTPHSSTRHFFFFWLKKKISDPPLGLWPSPKRANLARCATSPPNPPTHAQAPGCPTARSLSLRPRRPHPSSRRARARALWAVATHATGRAAAARTSRAHVAPTGGPPPPPRPPGTGGSAHALTVPRWRRRRRWRWRWRGRGHGHWRLLLALALDGKLAHVRQEDQRVAVHGGLVGGGAACARAPRTPLALAASRGPLVLLLTQAGELAEGEERHLRFTQGPPPLY